MKTNKTMLLTVAGALALLCASCNKNNPEELAEKLFGGEGNILVETTIKNADGATGQSYLQQILALSGTINMTEGLQVGFSSTLSFVDQYVFVFPEFGTNSNQSFTKYEHTPKGLKKVGELQTIPNSYPVNLSAASKEKAYVPMYNLGKVLVINPTTMELKSEIDLTGYAYTDSSADPASGLVVDGFYYLPLNQINSSWMPYEEHLQVDVAVIDTATDQVVKVISETASGLSFPTRPFLPGMIFTDEQKVSSATIRRPWRMALPASPPPGRSSTKASPGTSAERPSRAAITSPRASITANTSATERWLPMWGSSN